MKVNVMPSHELTISCRRLLQNFTGFYIIHAHDFITLTFCQDYWGWKYRTFLFFSFVFFQTWYVSWKTIFLVSSSDFCDRNAFVENLAIRAKVKSRLQPFFWTDKTAHGMKALIFCQKHEKNGIFRKIISEKARCQSSQGQRRVTQSEETKTKAKMWRVCMPDRDGQMQKKFCKWDLLLIGHLSSCFKCMFNL